MPTPYIPTELSAATGSYSMQNRNDAGGALATWLVLKGVKNCQLRTFNGGDTGDVLCQVDRGILAALSVSCAGALASTATGSF